MAGTEPSRIAHNPLQKEVACVLVDVKCGDANCRPEKDLATLALSGWIVWNVEMGERALGRIFEGQGQAPCR